MNVIAGLLIGWVGQDWLTRLLWVAGWAGIWCIIQTIFSGRRQHFVATSMLDAAESRHLRMPGPRWERKGWSPLRTFYFIEFSTAFLTALVFAGIVGLLRHWW